MTGVTVVSCLYGNRGYDRFIHPWAEAIRGLDPAAIEAIVAADSPYYVPGALVIVSRCGWRYPQAYYLQQAITATRTEWVWIVDIDDLAIPDALEGIGDVTADVWATGYLRSDGELFTPPQLTADEYLTLPGNPIAAGSMIRTEAFRACGGFPDVAFQDWALWQRLARRGASFKASTRAQYHYRRHEQTRTAVELRPELRAQHETELRGHE